MAAGWPGQVVGGVRELRRRLARQAPGQGIVGAVERRPGHGIGHHQDQNAGSFHAPADLRVGAGIVAILDVEIELASYGIIGVGERLLLVAIVI